MRLVRSQVNFHLSPAPGQPDPEPHIELSFNASLQEINEIYNQLPNNTLSEVEFKNLIGTIIGAPAIPYTIHNLQEYHEVFGKPRIQDEESSCKKKESVIDSSIRNIVITKR